MSNSDPKNLPRLGPWPPAPRPESNPAAPPSSWAKKIGFKPKLSSDTNATDSGQLTLLPKPRDPNADLEAVRVPPAQPPTNGVAHREKVHVPVPVLPPKDHVVVAPT